MDIGQESDRGLRIPRPLALITGASRSIGIGHSVALALAKSGWDIALTYWLPYDESMPWGSKPDEVEQLCAAMEEEGVRSIAIEADLSSADAATHIFDAVERDLGLASGMVLSHCHGVDSDILTTSVESFDRHFAVNTRATWLLIREFGKRYDGDQVPRSKVRGRIIAITSDHTVGNLPYGASKGAMDRIVLAAAHEFSHMGITANVINPGATDTGWMTDEQLTEFGGQVPLGRVGLPQDCANLVQFLCSEQGGWINGQLLKSNGGIA